MAAYVIVPAEGYWMLVVMACAQNLPDERLERGLEAAFHYIAVNRIHRITKFSAIDIIH